MLYCLSHNTHLCPQVLKHRIHHVERRLWTCALRLEHSVGFLPWGIFSLVSPTKFYFLEEVPLNSQLTKKTQHSSMMFTTGLASCFMQYPVSCPLQSLSWMEPGTWWGLPGTSCGTGRWKELIITNTHAYSLTFYSVFLLLYLTSSWQYSRIGEHYSHFTHERSLKMCFWKSHSLRATLLRLKLRALNAGHFPNIFHPQVIKIICQANHPIRVLAHRVSIKEKKNAFFTKQVNERMH